MGEKHKKKKEAKKRSSSSSSSSVKVKKKKDKTKEKEKKEVKAKAKESVKESAKEKERPKEKPKEAKAADKSKAEEKPAKRAAAEEKGADDAVAAAADAGKASPEAKGEKKDKKADKEKPVELRPVKKLKAWQDDELEVDSDEEVAKGASPAAAAAPAAASGAAADKAPAAAAAEKAAEKVTERAAGKFSDQPPEAKDEEVDALDAFMKDVADEVKKQTEKPKEDVKPSEGPKSITLEEIMGLMGQASPGSPPAGGEGKAASASAAGEDDDEEDEKFHAAFVAELKKMREMELPDESAMEFEKADTFAGEKAGMVFKKGPQGLGYYTDVAGQRIAAEKARAKAAAEAKEAERQRAEEAAAAKAAAKAAAGADGEGDEGDSDESSEEPEAEAAEASAAASASAAAPAAAASDGKVVESKKEKRRKRREAKEAEARAKAAAQKRKAVDGFGGGADQLMQNDAELSEESSEAEQENYFDLVKKFTTKKSLPATDHSQVEYIPFRKNLYVQVKEIANMKQHEVDDWRRTHGDIHVRGKHCPHPIKSFLQCGLPDKLIKLLEKRDIEQPFPVQMQAIPALMCGRDIIGVAQTGSGKTLAYLLPAMRHILDQPKIKDGDGPIVFCVAPTRELALQIQREANQLCKAVGLTSVSAVGGSPMGEQLSQLRKGCELLVGTPGRLIDVLTISGGKITNLRRVTFLILDEADRMFDMGFEPQIGMFLQATRPDKQVALFSATLPTHVEALARTVLKKPLEITVGERNTAAANVKQFVEVLEESQKFYRLLQLLGEWHEHGSIIIFVHQQRDVDEMFTELLKFGYPSLPLHGGQDQADRDFTLQDFKDGVANILIATSVAARGIDVKQVVLVINFKVPDHLEDYIHRIGRTGRAGKMGFAYTFIQPDEAESAQDMVDALRQCGQEVPMKLKALAEEHQSQVNAGNAKKKRRWGGFGGKSFKYDSTEKSQMQKDRQKAKKDLMIGDAAERDEQDQKFSDPWDEDKPMNKSAQDRKKDEEEKNKPKAAPPKGCVAAAASTVQAAMAMASRLQAAAQNKPPPPDAPPGAPPPPPPPGVFDNPAEFIPAVAFTGAREGMSFKTGPHGLGYYKDVVPEPPKPKPPPPPKAEADFIGAFEWQGPKPGMVFKLGDQGIGYYEDVPLLQPKEPGEEDEEEGGEDEGKPAPPPPPGAPPPPSRQKHSAKITGRKRTEEELDDAAERMAEETLKSLLEGENGEEVRKTKLPPLKAKLKEKLRKQDEEQAAKAAPVAPPPPPKFEAKFEAEPVMKALQFVPGVIGAGGSASSDATSMIVRSMEQMQKAVSRKAEETQDEASEMAALVASGTTIAPEGRFIEEFEINDYPEVARKRISAGEPKQAIEEISGAKIIVRGQHFADPRKMPEGARKLYVEIVGPTQLAVHKGKAEVRKMMEALAIRTLNIPGLSRAITGQPGRYDPATGK